MSGLTIAGSGLTLVDPLVSANVAITVGTKITGGTNTYVLYDNAGAIGEYPISGTGSVPLAHATNTGAMAIPRNARLDFVMTFLL